MYQELIERHCFWSKFVGLRLWTSSAEHPSQSVLALAPVQKTLVYWNIPKWFAGSF